MVVLQKVDEIQKQIDNLYQEIFGNIIQQQLQIDASQVSEGIFRQFSRDQPQILSSYIKEISVTNAQNWQSFQKETTFLKQQQLRMQTQIQDEMNRQISQARIAARATDIDFEAINQEGVADKHYVLSKPVRIVLICGFESFNAGLYTKVGQILSNQVENAELSVYSDIDIREKQDEVSEKLRNADVFFGSLLFDYEQVDWIRSQIQNVKVRFIFESALELMSLTQAGGFNMQQQPGKKSGPPPAVKKLLSFFGSQREEDKMVGYLSFLKVGPKILKFIPGNKAQDLKRWMTVYGYWNQGGLNNVLQMFIYIINEYLENINAKVVNIMETPATGLLHPQYTKGYFETPQQYLKWYQKEGPLRNNPDAPKVGVLLFRKHVITEQPYISSLINILEQQGIVPVPVFINGVEAHVILRDWLTTDNEQSLIRNKKFFNATLRKDAIKVDCVLNTIGFPLVGGPAGTMEGARQQEISREILQNKNIPYTVAAPLLIQDMESWVSNGVAGLQSVVLYSLPELDGAIDTIPLGGLSFDQNIYLVPERAYRLAHRIQKWIQLRRKSAQNRKIAVLLYGFPPNVGATGTAALLNVPQSLENVVQELKGQGYDLGQMWGEQNPDRGYGEKIIEALKELEDSRVQNLGKASLNQSLLNDIQKTLGEKLPGAQLKIYEVTPRQLKNYLTYSPVWGPNEWGPLPFLPDSQTLLQKMENQWGQLERYRGLNTTGQGSYFIGGVEIGNVFISVQPLLGIEGDPMRLLFERDLTPHPQYAATYKWLQEEYKADAVLHFGMHGTVEWLSGTPLGNTGLSWSDVLLGNLPNIYIYACNNPSESIIAKRRGYGTILSHNVPPYGRSGLYKQLAEAQQLIQEYREDPQANNSLRGPILKSLNDSGLLEDCPISNIISNEEDLRNEQFIQGIEQKQFDEYVSQVYQYLQFLENRLFSEGLHVYGEKPNMENMRKYLDALFNEDLSEPIIKSVTQSDENSPYMVVNQIQSELSPDEIAAYRNGKSEKLQEAIDIRNLLAENKQEVSQLSRALNGEYIQPEAGGDLLRDGKGVLPTGRNIHALDPYRMPSLPAVARGSEVAKNILDEHQKKENQWPQTIAVNLWGLDAIKTKGESVAIVLALVGAKVVREGTGRVAKFELIPLDELKRPRVDVLCNMSGIFRDSFQNVVELLDDLFFRAANAEEPESQNFIKAHSNKMKAKKIDNSSARLFCNPPGDYGSMVNERVGSSNWESNQELGETWQSRNSFSYGKGNERGTPRPEVLKEILSNTDRVVQEIDSLEYGLTDIQEYYANTGALKQAAENAQGGKKVGASIVESFSKDTKPYELEDLLRIEYRTKLLNPKWAEAMVKQGSGGAYEISSRMTAMLGWGATTNFKDKWTWDQAAQNFALDKDMAERLRKANPQAFRNIVGRMLEASGRDIWQPDSDTLNQLKSMYQDIEDQMEGV